ncbi:hypothetical protein FTW19_04390 [Terriglobus albidus]|uniref:RiboL-PSP-HEPN domain-containing protein n=1 Tax=Terriglobus albidus TaxID=1592106 RepID=A0A5B9EBC0_9BACT|nr:hypothetical protein [Terriglobus albidus]QEE27316.1 hypothetical protein FTW19_04390 [Terriglobus albidus]
MLRPLRYLIPSTGKNITRAQLKRKRQELQIEAMRDWFEDNFESPDELPYDSAEGGYQWIWGGPYDAEEQLQTEFGGIVADEVIEELASDLNDISLEWSGKPEPPDDDYFLDLLESGPDPYINLISSLVEIEDAARIEVFEKDRRILHKLLYANIIAALETFLGDLFIKTLSKSDEYTENFVRKTAHFQNTPIKLSDIFERFKKIDAEVRNFVLAHNWHRLDESSMMYKRAFGVVFPVTPEGLKTAIRDRHDIVHRNGRTSDGAEGSWNLAKILALKKIVAEYSCELNDLIAKLPPKEPLSEEF